MRYRLNRLDEPIPFSNWPDFKGEFKQPFGKKPFKHKKMRVHQKWHFILTPRLYSIQFCCNNEIKAVWNFSASAVQNIVKFTKTGFVWCILQVSKQYRSGTLAKTSNIKTCCWGTFFIKSKQAIAYIPSKDFLIMESSTREVINSKSLAVEDVFQKITPCRFVTETFKVGITNPQGFYDSSNFYFINLISQTLTLRPPHSGVKISWF